jgi:hypothetical protein
MRRHVQRFAALGLAIGLAACFESTEPLIGTDGDFPFGDGVRYTFYEWDKEKGVWQPNETGTVQREGDHYVELDDGGQRNDASPIRFKDIGNGGYFIAQQRQDNGVYIYDLLKVQSDNLAYQFGFACRTEDRKFADQGLIDSFTADERWGNTCKVSDLDKLKRVFLAIAAEVNQPQGMYAITK